MPATFCAISRLVELAQREPVGDVLRHRHVRPQRVALEDHRHVALLGRQRARRRRHHAVADRDLARRRLDEARDQPQRRGLAAARGPEQADQQPVLDAQRHVVDDGQIAVALGQPAQFDRRHVPSYRFIRRLRLSFMAVFALLPQPRKQLRLHHRLGCDLVPRPIPVIVVGNSKLSPVRAWRGMNRVSRSITS